MAWMGYALLTERREKSAEASPCPEITQLNPAGTD
jgi:hypothetical protein